MNSSEFHEQQLVERVKILEKEVTLLKKVISEMNMIKNVDSSLNLRRAYEFYNVHD